MIAKLKNLGKIGVWTKNHLDFMGIYPNISKYIPTIYPNYISQYIPIHWIPSHLGDFHLLFAPRVPPASSAAANVLRQCAPRRSGACRRCVGRGSPGGLADGWSLNGQNGPFFPTKMGTSHGLTKFNHAKSSVIWPSRTKSSGFAQQKWGIHQERRLVLPTKNVI